MTAKLKATQAELRLLGALDTGATNKQVATAMHKSEQTVRNQLSTLYRKINVSNRTQAVCWYRDNKPLVVAPTQNLMAKYLLNVADEKLLHNSHAITKAINIL